MIQRINTNTKIILFTFRDSLKAIFTDSGAILVFILATVLYPVIYSIAYSKEVINEIPTVIVDCDNTNTGRTWAKMLDASPQIKITDKVGSMTEAEDIFWQGKANAILMIPKDFEKKILKGEQATISMYADAGNFLYYKETFKGTMKVTGMLNAGIEYKHLLAKGQRPEQAVNQIQPFTISAVNLYNPSAAYGSFVMPGIMLLIIQQTLLIGIGLVGGAGRERKRTNTDTNNLNLSKYAVSVIIGKSLAYFVIGIFDFIFAIIFIYDWFTFPAMGEIFNIMALVIPYLFSVIFLGLNVSLLFKHREQSIMFLVFLSPILLFITGLSWPLEAIPTILHKIFAIFPSTQMVPAFIRIRTMGVGLVDVKQEFIVLLLQMLFYFIFAVLGFKLAMKKKNRGFVFEGKNIS